MKNRIYFFTGTGNSLRVAQAIANTLPDCELMAIYKDTSLEVPAGFERIGFVFPNYSGGPPRMVVDFIRKMKLPKQQSTYLFAISTYGGNAGNINALIEIQLEKRNWQLQYGATVWAYPNAVIFYPMIKLGWLIEKISGRKIKRVIQKIVSKEQEPIPALDAAAQKRYEDFMAQIHNSDSGYYVNDDCMCCGVCTKVCPAKNITLVSGKPIFHHDCQSCMACIQHCPKQAINYRDKTEKRGRYVNPDVGAQAIIRYYERKI